MAIKRTFNGRLIIHPGAYSKIVVENLTGFPLQDTSTVGIIGEAVGGEPRVLDILTREGIQDAKSRYKSGPIADALELLANPSSDPRIPNGASKIVVYKVNSSQQSQLNLMNSQAVPAAQVLMKSANYGSDENLLNILVSEGAVTDMNARIYGSVAGPFALAGGETLIVMANNVSYTYTGTLSGGAISAAALVADLNNPANWASAKPVIASAVGNMIHLELDPAVVLGAELDYGYLKIDAASTLDTIIGMSGEARGRKGSRIASLAKGVMSEITLELGGADLLSIKYVGAGSAAAMDLKMISNELRLQTSITGAASDNLDILLMDVDGKNKHTIKSLVDLINANAAYQAAVLASNPAQNANELDYYEGLDIRNVAAKLRADVSVFVSYINTYSQLAVAEKLHNVYRSIKPLVAVQFFAGASDGSMSNSDWADGFEALKEERINVVVPLLSKDVGAVSIASINQLGLNHALWGWSTDGKNERAVFTSFLGSKDNYKAQCKAINSAYVSCFGQEVRVLDRNSDLVWLEPWAAACLAAGMRAGAEVGEPITYKLINANDMRVLDSSWNPKKDYAEMIEAGCTFAEPLDSGGFRWVVGNTTYSVDGSFVWNRESVVQAAGFVAYDLRYNLELVFTGTKARTGTAEAIANFIKARMSTYLENEIITGDDLNKGLGYRADTLRISVQGNTAIINVCITPVQGIDFILPTIYLADIRQSA